MANSIKTQLLQELVVALQTASSLITVKRFPPTATRLDSAKAPIAYIYEPVPETKENNNRYSRGILELDIIVFIELKSDDVDNGNLTFLDKADTIQAEIHDILYGPGHTNLKGLALRILDRTVEKSVPNDAWGVLIYTIEVTYQHLTGDAFNR